MHNILISKKAAVADIIWVGCILIITTFMLNGIKNFSYSSLFVCLGVIMAQSTMIVFGIYHRCKVITPNSILVYITIFVGIMYIYCLYIGTCNNTVLNFIVLTIVIYQTIKAFLVYLKKIK
jgi:hypothetical protein